MSKGTPLQKLGLQHNGDMVMGIFVKPFFKMGFLTKAAENHMSLYNSG